MGDRDLSELAYVIPPGHVTLIIGKFINLCFQNCKCFYCTNYFTDENRIAGIFNEFFISKTATLKQGIDKDMIKDPLEKLRKKMESKKLKFSLRQVTDKQVEKTMKKMAKKKSAGIDGITQKNLILGAEVSAIPLARIINYLSHNFMHSVNYINYNNIEFLIKKYWT